MLVTIHQPDFLPWLGFFDRWNRADLYIVLDDVQFIRRGWHHRDKIKTSQGDCWLTVPVRKKGRYFQKINEVEIDAQDGGADSLWPRIEQAYKRAPKYSEHAPDLRDIFQRQHRLLIDLNMDLLKYCQAKLGIRTPVIFSSSIHVDSTGSQRLIDLLEAVQGTTYLTGLGSKDYLDEAVFANRSIEVVWQNFTPAPYPQLYDGFSGMLSVLDYLFMDGSPKILCQ